jgi:glycosyltransferase involved in cell wall biosynthesis
VARARPDSVLLLVGDGPERSRLEEKARSMNLLPNVVFTGPVSYSDMPAHVAAMDVGLVMDPALGKYHYSPLKSWEYMAAGKAIVSPTSGQMKRVLRDGRDALLVEPGAADPIARAVLRLHDDAELRAALQVAARARVATDGSWDHRLQTIEDALIARGLLPFPELELASSA